MAAAMKPRRAELVDCEAMTLKPPEHERVERSKKTRVRRRPLWFAAILLLSVFLLKATAQFGFLSALRSSLSLQGDTTNIDSVLNVDSAAIVRKAVKHYRLLVGRAAKAAARGETIYGTFESPLFAFLIPKTGSNSQLFYHLQALAALGQTSYFGCEPPDRYSCMHGPDHLPKVCTAVAFGTHFRPSALLSQVAEAPCPDRLRPWATASHSDILAHHSVCTMVFRHPIERAISSFYEWYYKQQTNLTAIEYFHEHGAERFSSLVESQMAYARLATNSDDIETALTSCILGITENVTQHVVLLSRVLLVAPPEQEAVHERSRPRFGMSEADVSEMYEQLAPHLQKDMALWQLATIIATEQSRIVEKYKPLFAIHTAERPLGEGAECPECGTCTPPGWESIQWGSYPTKGGCVGPAIFDGDQKCCGSGEGVF